MSLRQNIFSGQYHHDSIMFEFIAYQIVLDLIAVEKFDAAKKLLEDVISVIPDPTICNQALEHLNKAIKEQEQLRRRPSFFSYSWGLLIFSCRKIANFFYCCESKEEDLYEASESKSSTTPLSYSSGSFFKHQEAIELADTPYHALNTKRK